MCVFAHDLIGVHAELLEFLVVLLNRAVFVAGTHERVLMRFHDHYHARVRLILGGSMPQVRYG